MSLYSSEPAKGWLPWGALAPILCIVFIAAPLLGVSEILIYMGLVDVNDEPIGIYGILAFLLFPFSAMGLVVLAWVYFIERRPFSSIGLTGQGKARLFIHGCFVGVVTTLSVVLVIWVAGGFEGGGFLRAFSSPIGLINIVMLFICFAVQSSVEEIIFRGWLFSVIIRKFNVVSAFTIVSIVFTFLHYSPDQYWLVTLDSFLFSMFACSWAYYTGNVWGVMGWHSGWNWFMGVGFELPITGLDLNMPALLVKLTPIGPNYLNGGHEGPEGSVFCVIFFACATIYLLWKIRTKSTSQNLDTPS